MSPRKQNQIPTNNFCIGYCRVSSEDQASNGLSLDAQEHSCREAIKREGKYQLLKVIRDEGKSGGSIDGRPGMKEIVQLILNRSIAAVYTLSSDRLARNAFDHLYLRELFKKYGIELRYIHQQNGDGSPYWQTMDTVLASFNELQRLVTSQKVKLTFKTKAEKGYYPSVAPVGYRNAENPEKNTDRFSQRIIVPDPVMGPLVGEAFRLYATGHYNAYELNDLMYEKGFRTKKGGKLSTCKMSPSRFYGMLRNKIYLGELHHGEVHITKAKHEPLVDHETFDKVQEILETHNNHACRRRKYSWLLSGFVYCHNHQKRYCSEWHLNKKIAYYHCSFKGSCGKYVEQTLMENMVADKFKELEFNQDFVERIIQKAREQMKRNGKVDNSRRQALVNRKTAYEGQLRTAKEKLLEGVFTNEEYIETRDMAQAEIMSIERQLDEFQHDQEPMADVAKEILGYTSNIHETYSRASNELKRQYLQFFWEKFEVEEGLIIKSCPGLLFRELLQLEQMYVNRKTPRLQRNSTGYITGRILRE